MLGIMITIKSKWCRLMESGDKIIEVRKNKALANAIKKIIIKYGKCLIVVCESGTNGKVPFRFWCDKVEETSWQNSHDRCGLYAYIIEKSCLTEKQLWDYVQDRTFYAIHISKLEIFDEPRELFDFKIQCKKYKKAPTSYSCRVCTYLNYYTLKPETRHLCSTELTKAPQNYCYVEGEE